jgi:hypothetical protein
VTAGKEGAISGGDKFISVSSAERQHRQLSTCSAIDSLQMGWCVAQHANSSC